MNVFVSQKGDYHDREFSWNQRIEENVRAQAVSYGITDEKIIQRQIDTAVENNFEEAVAEAKKSDEFKKAAEEAYDKAHEEVTKKVDEKWDEIS